MRRGQAKAARWAHPRVCGENAGMTDTSGRPLGSSPRVRGKLGGNLTLRRLPRLIPACAGKTWVPGFFLFSGWAHPRVCGENAFATGNIFTATGSSPRVRGKLGRRRLGCGV